MDSIHGSTCGNCETSKKEYDKELAKVKTVFVECKKKMMATDKMFRQLAMKKKQCSEAESRVTEIQTDLNECREKLKTNMKDLQLYEDKCESSESRIATLSSELGVAESNVMLLTQQNARLEQLKLENVTKLESIKEELNESKESIETLENKLTKLKSRLAAQAEQSTPNKAVNKLKDELAARVLELSLLRQELETKDEIGAEKSERGDGSDAASNGESQELLRLKEELVAKKKELKAQVTKNKKLEAKLLETDGSVASPGLRSDAAKVLTAVQDELAQLKAELESKTRELKFESSRNAKLAANNKRSAKAEVSPKLRSAVDQTISYLEAELSTKEAELVELAQQLEGVRGDAERKRKEAERCRPFEEQWKASESRVTQLSGELAKRRERDGRLEAALAQRDKVAAGLKAEVEALLLKVGKSGWGPELTSVSFKVADSCSSGVSSCNTNDLEEELEFDRSARPAVKANILDAPETCLSALDVRFSIPLSNDHDHGEAISRPFESLPDLDDVATGVKQTDRPARTSTSTPIVEGINADFEADSRDNAAVIQSIDDVDENGCGEDDDIFQILRSVRMPSALTPITTPERVPSKQRSLHARLNNVNELADMICDDPTRRIVNYGNRSATNQIDNSNFSTNGSRTSVTRSSVSRCNNCVGGYRPKPYDDRRKSFRGSNDEFDKPTAMQEKSFLNLTETIKYAMKSYGDTYGRGPRRLSRFKPISSRAEEVYSSNSLRSDAESPVEESRTMHLDEIELLDGERLRNGEHFPEKKSELHKPVKNDTRDTSQRVAMEIPSTNSVQINLEPLTSKQKQFVKEPVHNLPMPKPSAQTRVMPTRKAIVFLSELPKLPEVVNAVRPQKMSFKDLGNSVAKPATVASKSNFDETLNEVVSSWKRDHSEENVMVQSPTDEEYISRDSSRLLNKHSIESDVISCSENLSSIPSLILDEKMGSVLEPALSTRLRSSISLNDLDDETKESKSRCVQSLPVIVDLSHAGAGTLNNNVASASITHHQETSTNHSQNLSDPNKDIRKILPVPRKVTVIRILSDSKKSDLNENKHSIEKDSVTNISKTSTYLKTKKNSVLNSLGSSISSDKQPKKVLLDCDSASLNNVSSSTDEDDELSLSIIKKKMSKKSSMKRYTMVQKCEERKMRMESSPGSVGDDSGSEEKKTVDGPDWKALSKEWVAKNNLSLSVSEVKSPGNNSRTIRVCKISRNHCRPVSANNRTKLSSPIGSLSKKQLDSLKDSKKHGPQKSFELGDSKKRAVSTPMTFPHLSQSFVKTHTIEAFRTVIPNVEFCTQLIRPNDLSSTTTRDLPCDSPDIVPEDQSFVGIQTVATTVTSLSTRCVVDTSDILVSTARLEDTMKPVPKTVSLSSYETKHFTSEPILLTKHPHKITTNSASLSDSFKNLDNPTSIFDEIIPTLVTPDIVTNATSIQEIKPFISTQDEMNSDNSRESVVSENLNESVENCGSEYNCAVMASECDTIPDMSESSEREQITEARRITTDDSLSVADRSDSCSDSISTNEKKGEPDKEVKPVPYDTVVIPDDASVSLPPIIPNVETSPTVCLLDIPTTPPVVDQGINIKLSVTSVSFDGSETPESSCDANSRVKAVLDSNSKQVGEITKVDCDDTTTLTLLDSPPNLSTMDNSIEKPDSKISDNGSSTVSEISHLPIVPIPLKFSRQDESIAISSTILKSSSYENDVVNSEFQTARSQRDLLDKIIARVNRKNASKVTINLFKVVENHVSPAMPKHQTLGKSESETSVNPSRVFLIESTQNNSVDPFSTELLQSAFLPPDRDSSTSPVTVKPSRTGRKLCVPRMKRKAALNDLFGLPYSELQSPPKKVLSSKTSSISNLQSPQSILPTEENFAPTKPNRTQHKAANKSAVRVSSTSCVVPRVSPKHEMVTRSGVAVSAAVPITITSSTSVTPERPEIDQSRTNLPKKRKLLLENNKCDTISNRIGEASVMDDKFITGTLVGSPNLSNNVIDDINSEFNDVNMTVNYNSSQISSLDVSPSNSSSSTCTWSTERPIDIVAATSTKTNSDERLACQPVIKLLKLPLESNTTKSTASKSILTKVEIIPPRERGNLTNERTVKIDNSKSELNQLPEVVLRQLIKVPNIENEPSSTRVVAASVNVGEMNEVSTPKQCATTVSSVVEVTRVEMETEVPTDGKGSRGEADSPRLDGNAAAGLACKGESRCIATPGAGEDDWLASTGDGTAAGDTREWNVRGYLLRTAYERYVDQSPRQKIHLQRVKVNKAELQADMKRAAVAVKRLDMIEEKEGGSRVLAEIVETLKGIGSELVIKLVLQAASADEEGATGGGGEVAPALTPTQRRLVVLIAALDCDKPLFASDLLTALQTKLCHLGQKAIDDAVLGRFTNLFVAVCLSRQDAARIRAFLYDVMYCYCGSRGHAISLRVLTMAPKVLPHAYTAKGDVLTQTLVRTLLTERGDLPNRNKPLASLLSLRHKYDLKKLPTGLQLVQLMVTRLKQGDCRNMEAALTLLAKREGWAWAHRHMVNELTGLLTLRRAQLIAAEPARVAVRVVAHIARTLPKNRTDLYVGCLGKIQDVILLDMAELHETAILSLMGLCLHKQHVVEIAKVLLNWAPTRPPPDCLVQKVVAFMSRESPVTWRSFFKKFKTISGHGGYRAFRSTHFQ